MQARNGRGEPDLLVRFLLSRKVLQLPEKRRTVSVMRTINWQQTIADLSKQGWTHQAIADHCGMARQTVTDIASGQIKEPGGMRAIRLHHLWQQQSRKAQRNKA